MTQEEVKEEFNLTHAIILNSNPFYVFAHNEESAIKIAEHYGNTTLGIIVAPKGLLMKNIKTKITLEDLHYKALPHFIKNNDGSFEEVIQNNELELDDEEKAILEG